MAKIEIQFEIYNMKAYVNFFTQRVVGPWNSLPEQVISAPTLNSFKTRLDKQWFYQPMLYDFRASLDTKNMLS